MSNDLRTLHDSVIDEETFVRFLAALAADRARGAHGWENETIEAFLERAASWAQDSKSGLAHYIPPSNSWKRCADILFMGKIYE